VYDASHMWVKNVTIGYTLPKINSFLSNTRLYMNVDNLFLITNYPGNNPDVNMKGGINPGYDDVTYPVARTYSFGARINF
jgi:TonB-dependent starch-binding outer membrane protein SusC